MQHNPPLASSSKNPFSSRATDRSILPLLTLAVALGLTVVLFMFAQQALRGQEEDAFVLEASLFAHALQEEVGEARAAVTAVAIAVALSDFDRAQFAILTDSVRSASPELSDAAWAPKVSSAELARFVADAQDDGHAEYALYEWSPDDVRVAAQQRPTHYPILFSSASSGAEARMGLDLSANERIVTAIEKARDSGTATAAVGIGNADDSEAYTFTPVYEDGVIPNDVDERREAFAGVVVARLDVPALVVDAFDLLEGGETDLTLYVSVTDPVSDGELGGTVPPGQAPLLERQASELVYRHSITVADRTWTLTAIPSGPLLRGTVKDLPFAVLAVGTMIALLATAYVRSATGQSKRLALALSERTHALGDVNKDLAVEAQRASIAEMSATATSVRLKSVLETIPDLMMVIRTDGTFTEVLTPDHPLLVVPAHDVIGKSAWDVYPPEFAAITMEKVEEAARSGQPQTLTFQSPWDIPGFDGTYEARFVASNATEVLLVTRDVSEAAKAQRALEVSEERFRVMFEAMPVGIAVKDDTNTVMMVNEATAEMFGVPAEDLVGKRLNTRLGPSNRLDTLGRRAALQDGSLDSFETLRPYVRPDGTEFWVRRIEAAVRDKEGRFQYAIAVLEDTTEQRAAANAVRASEEQFRVLFESSPTGLILQAEDLKIVAANPAMLAMFQCTEDEMVGTTLIDRVSPSTGRTRQGQHGAMVRGETDRFEFERLYVRPDGSEVLIKGVQAAVRAPNGRLVTAVVGLEDITEQRRAEEEVRASERRFRLLFETAPIGLALKDRDNKITAVNAATAEMFGLAEDELIGSRFEDYRPSWFIRTGRNEYSKMVDGSLDRVEFDRSYTRSDGSDFIASGIQAAVRDEDGKFRYAILGMQDVTAQRQAEDGLRASEEQFRVLFESSPVALLLVGDDGKISAPNGAAIELFGCTEEELIGTTLRSWHSPALYQSGLGRRAAMMNGEIDRYEFERVYIRPDGGEFVVLGAQAAVRNQDGTYRYAVVSLEDVTEQRRAEEELRTSEERFRVLFESSPIGLATVAADLTVLAVNANALALFGCTEEQVVGRTMRSMISPSFVLDSRGNQAKMISGEIDGFEFERHFVRPDGSDFWAKANQAAVRDADGVFQYGIMGLEDITAQRSANEVLQASEQKFRVLFESSPIGMAMVGPDANVIAANPAALSIFGLTERELIGRGFQDWQDPTYEYLRTGNFVALVDGKIEQSDVERPYLRQDGVRFWAQMHQAAVRDDQGVFLFAIITLEDITEKRLAASDLLASEERFRTLVESAPVGISVVDEANHMITTNPALEALLGYSHEELVGRSLAEFRVRTEPSSGIRSTAAMIADRAEPLVWERLFRRKNGSEVWTQVITAAYHSQREGAAVRMVVDISERKQVEKIKDEFLNMVSHELRTPLTAIVTSVQLSATGALGPLPEKVARMLDIASENSDRLMRMVNDVLDMERMNSGRVRLQLDKFTAASIAEQAARSAGAQASDAGVMIEIAARPIPMQGDEDRLVQALTNLVSNAAKFSPAGTSVEIVADDLGDDVEFKIIDHGCGIPPEETGKVFDRFHQVNATDSQINHGTGLGLAITRWIAEQHGGAVRVESKEGNGSIFFLTIPKRVRRESIELGARTE